MLAPHRSANRSMRYGKSTARATPQSSSRITVAIAGEFVCGRSWRRAESAVRWRSFRCVIANRKDEANNLRRAHSA
ncbi:hypothetical protein EVAR_79293_1 [Eumeta japonica]|uniref:Uncharacterized protein n=1 Tax=Eumeta variegata TaxID=151549 RepID=A0A4C1THM4_EUMVA|nr:hypothetical protein EVAR_79293_1 [Eumeta japonica]